MKDQPSAGASAVKSGSDALQLLNRQPPAEYRREWTERIAGRKSTAARPAKSVIAFRIGPEWLALPTSLFQEIAQQCSVHTVPHRQGEALAGLVNVRGELLLCASLGALLGITPSIAPAKESPGAPAPRLLVANRHGNRLVIPVDEVHGVLRYDDADLLPAPATLTHARGQFTIGLLPWNGKTVGCLDDERLFQILDQSFR